MQSKLLLEPLVLLDEPGTLLVLGKSGRNRLGRQIRNDFEQIEIAFQVRVKAISRSMLKVPMTSSR